MEDTHFANPNGLNDDAIFTAADMALLAAEVLRHEAMAEIRGHQSITLGARPSQSHKVLWQYRGCEGMKTAIRSFAVRTLVYCAGGKASFVSAWTLCDPDDWKDHALCSTTG
jgi:D-alanyl-D-alanine carboxypeptidase